MLKMAKVSRPSLFCLLMAACLLTACAGGRLFDAAVDPGRRVPLPERGVREGVADAGTVRVHYRIEAVPTSGSQTGPSITVHAQIQDLFFRVDAARVVLLFLDADGRPVSRHPVYAVGFKTREVMVAGRTLSVPPGVSEVAFAAFTQEASGNR
jgi:hypothetical protein